MSPRRHRSSRRPAGPAGIALVFALGCAGAASATQIVVDSTADDFDHGANGNCTLREAVLAANRNTVVDGCPAGQIRPTVDQIVVPAGTYVLTIPGTFETAGEIGDLDVRDDVEILGDPLGGSILDGGDLDRVFHIDPFPSFAIEATLADLVIQGGNGQTGGAIANLGTLTLLRSTVRDSHASLSGGGVANLGADATTTLIDSTLRDNSTDVDGAGAFNSLGSLTLRNSTLSGNHAARRGGGIGNEGELVLENVTLAANSAEEAASAIENDVLGSISLRNTLIEGDCSQDPAVVVTTLGGNLESPGDSCDLEAPDDQVNVPNALLGPLADNGGSTDTHRLLPGSPAIDGALQEGCPEADQRGVPRIDGACDVGAYEAEAPVALFDDGFESGDTNGWSASIPD